jgi:hypothetical protein
MATTAYLTLGNVKQLACTTTNLSEGGVALDIKEPIGEAPRVEVRFDLPGVGSRLEAHGEFAWSDGKAHTGIRST